MSSEAAQVPVAVKEEEEKAVRVYECEGNINFVLKVHFDFSRFRLEDRRLRALGRSSEQNKVPRGYSNRGPLKSLLWGSELHHAMLHANVTSKFQDQSCISPER